MPKAYHETDAERLAMALMAYIGEHTDVSREQILAVFEAQDMFWETWLESANLEVPWKNNG